MARIKHEHHLPLFEDPPGVRMDNLALDIREFDREINRPGRHFAPIKGHLLQLVRGLDAAMPEDFDLRARGTPPLTGLVDELLRTQEQLRAKSSDDLVQQNERQAQRMADAVYAVRGKILPWPPGIPPHQRYKVITEGTKSYLHYVERFLRAVDEDMAKPGGDMRLEQMPHLTDYIGKARGMIAQYQLTEELRKIRETHSFDRRWANGDKEVMAQVKAEVQAAVAVYNKVVRKPDSSVTLQLAFLGVPTPVVVNDVYRDLRFAPFDFCRRCMNDISYAYVADRKALKQSQGDRGVALMNQPCAMFDMVHRTRIAFAADRIYKYLDRFSGTVKNASLVPEFPTPKNEVARAQMGVNKGSPDRGRAGP